MTVQPGANLYTQGFGSRPESVEVPVISAVVPNSTNINYPIGKRWVDTTTNSEYSLTSISSIGGTVSATWTLLGAGSGDLNTLTTQDSTVVTPSAGNINISGFQTVQTTGSGHTITISPTSAGYPLTPWVVGPLLFDGEVKISGYATLQSAINQFNGQFGPFVVSVQPGWYVENLNFARSGFPQDIHIVGQTVTSEGNIQEVGITGIHTLPSTGTVMFENINFSSGEASPNLFMGDAGTGGAFFSIVFKNCNFDVETGYILSLQNFSGRIDFIDCGLYGTDEVDAIIDNTGGSLNVNIRNSILGLGSANSAIFGGTINIQNSQINCPINFQSGSIINCISSVFNQPITLSNNSTGSFQFCEFSGNSSAPLTMSSSAAISLYNNIINTSNNPAIAGSGAGTLTLGNITFVNNSLLANTLTTAWIPTKLGAVTVTGALTSSTTLTATLGNITATNGNLVMSTAGNKIVIPATSSATCSAGTFTLAGAATTVVSNSAVTANSLIFLQTQALGTVTAPSSLAVTAKSANTSFTVTPSASTDTSTIAYLIIN